MGEDTPKSAPQELTRRKYMQYAAAGIATAAVTGLGYYLTALSSTQPQLALTRTETSSLSLPAPTADFEYEPSYIKPTSADTIHFLNKSQNPDGIETGLAYSWYVDDKMVANTKDFSTQLSSDAIGTPHNVRLSACRADQCGDVEKVVEVDPDEIYPPTELQVPLKSIVYDAGTQYKYEGWDNRRWLSEEQFKRELVDVINRELGCNAVRLTGTDHNYLFRVAEIAINQGHFDKILINPRFIDCTRDEVLDKIVEFARGAEDLRQRHNGIVFSIGNELAQDTKGIGSDLRFYQERAMDKWDTGWKDTLDDFLEDLSSAVSGVFNGELTYAAGYWELPIDWAGLGLNVISVNEYLDSGRPIADMNRQLSELRAYADSRRKQLWITEFGCATFEGAFEIGGMAWAEKGKTYSQEAQADGIKKYLQIFNEVQPEACTLHQFWEWNEDDSTSFAITKFRRSMPPQRKLGFYVYKSYQRVS